jgi:prepilin-type N-terminal cleavage/methylation domain-containing protein
VTCSPLRTDTRSRAGFTLVELMITVAIIGILASIAIPSFLNFQHRSRRSEGYANVVAIARLEQTYYGEYNRFQPADAMPGPTLNVSKRVWTPAAELEFATIGFSPDGAVYHDYEVHIDASACPAQDCFTVTAYGDADGDGFVSLTQYVQPNATGLTSTSALWPGLGIPTNPSTSTPILNTVAANYTADNF